MSAKPLHDLLLVQKSDSPDRTEGGLFIPQNSEGEFQKGVVKAAGQGTYSINGTLMPLSVKVGDIIIFAKGAGQQLKVGGETLLALRERDALCVVDE